LRYSVVTFQRRADFAACSRHTTSKSSRSGSEALGVPNTTDLAVWFGVHVLFPLAGKVDLFAVAVAVAAFVLMLKWKLDVFPVVIGAGVLGLLYKLLL